MIYTFYSYKGGVGRSMALANIAECFREKHLRVLMIDWDLEAPGLEAYFYPSENGSTSEQLHHARRQPGLIDMLYEYKMAYPRFVEQRSAALAPPAMLRQPDEAQTSDEDRARATATLEEQLKSIDVPEFLLASVKESLKKAQPADQPVPPVRELPEFLDHLYGASPDAGSTANSTAGPLLASPLRRYVQQVHETEGLYLLGAGARGPDQFKAYAAAVQDFDWAEFYAAFEGRSYFEWLRTRLLTVAEVILIDSRTGVTEMGGVCTRQMPDAVVSFCAPNWQNIDGVVRVVAGLNERSLCAARDNREVDVLVVPTRIDDAESGLLNEFRERFIQTAEKGAIPSQFKELENPLWNLRIPYIPRYNYREQRVIGPNSATADPPTERLLAAYRKIAVHLAVLAGRNEADLKVKEAFNAEIALHFAHLGPARSPRMAPRPPAGYVERKESESRLKSLLQAGERIAVWGRAGTGKTSFTAFVVNQPEVQEQFPDGTLWLSNDRVWTPEAISAFFRSSFGLLSNYRESAVSEFLDGRHFLVVIDDIREQPSIDRIVTMGRNATYVLLTRDLALASKFARNLIMVGDFDIAEREKLIGNSLSSPETDPAADSVSQLASLFTFWPAGAAATRASHEISLATGQALPQPLDYMADRFRKSGISDLDALSAAGQAQPVTRTIRDAIGQLEPAEKRLLVQVAKGGRIPADSPLLRRLADYGLLDSAQAILPIVRWWLVYTCDLPDPLAKAHSGPDSERSQLQQDRARAHELLRGSAASVEEIVKIAGRLKNARSFSLARRLLGRAVRLSEFGTTGERVRLKVIQQYALCTYRDVEISTAERCGRAIEILETADLNALQPSQETLGLAGAAYKNWWRQEGQRSHLERSFAFYERGAKGPLKGDYGYTRINAAFVLDLLAHQEQDDSPDTSASRRVAARRMRQEIVDQLPGLAATPEHAFLRTQWWYFATLAEACFGLASFDASRFWLREGLSLEVHDWEKESTTRQLADLAWAQGREMAEQSEEWRTLRVLAGDAVPALRALAAGKVGLALSGGGFRASLFHIGVLAKLAEADLLRHVEVLSCVSGGSIAGAHLYLELRHLLQTKADYDITREDYIAIVRRMQRDFLDGVQMNLRTLLFRSWLANWRTLLQPGYTRTQALGSLFERHIYSRVADGHTGPRYLSDLRIKPFGTHEDFNPKLDNWRRSARVPILLLNATVLNTGHNWQFAVTWMGEPPPGQGSVDGNDVLRRLYYDDEAPASYRQVPLGLAVAASACVPALFDPVEMPGLYPGRSVRLVDGGVHDNQGTAGLLEQECRRLVVSDASGHMNSERYPGTGVLAVPTRSNSILMGRVRESQFRELDSLKRSSALTGLMFLHLKKDLPVNRVDWTNCQDPYEASDEANPGQGRLVLTGYGMPRIAQELLAGIRTDLDSFSDAEAYALMLSGYRMAGHDLKNDLPRFSPGDSRREPWDFLEIERALSQGADSEGDPDRLLRILRTGRFRGLKVWRLSVPSAVLGCLIALAAAIVLGWAGLTGWLTFQVLWIPLGVFPLWLVHRLLGSRKSLTVLFTGVLMVTVGWLVAAFHLAIFDPIYRRYGRVRVSGRESQVRTDRISVVIVLLVSVAMIGAGFLRFWAPATRTPPAPQETAASLAVRALSARQAGQYDAALVDYSAAIARGLTPQLLRDRAYTYKLQKRFQESKQDLEVVLRLEPDDRTSKDLAYIDELLTPKATRPPARR